MKVSSLSHASIGNPKRPRVLRKIGIPVLLCVGCVFRPAMGQQSTPAGSKDADHQLIQQLVERVAQLESQLQELKKTEVGQTEALLPTLASAVALARARQKEPAETNRAEASVNPDSVVAGLVAEPAPQEAAPPEEGPHEHTMEIPGGGPALKIRGFLDFNLGFGPDANPLIFPLTTTPGRVHNSFQFGEFDLFVTSQISNTVSFLSEIVFGSDASNNWGVDVERAQVSFRPSEYFQISAGRYHTSIGYYSTAFHHGTWFQTATGRPFMYFFEDAGGILPVHGVGITATGLVPRTGKLNLHWIAEAGNGVNSSFIAQPAGNAPVQNFLSDKNRKAFNIAGYVKPDWLPGLQIGGSYYHDRLVPEGVPHMNQNIGSAYVVYITPEWEFLNEFVVQRAKPDGQRITFTTPMGYTQISRKFGKYRPYFRWQYVNVPKGDPLYPSVGRYEGPSAGVRFDLTGYAALKVQYNRLYQRVIAPENGVDTQVSFTF